MTDEMIELARRLVKQGLVDGMRTGGYPKGRECRGASGMLFTWQGESLFIPDIWIARDPMHLPDLTDPANGGLLLGMLTAMKPDEANNEWLCIEWPKNAGQEHRDPFSWWVGTLDLSIRPSMMYIGNYGTTLGEACARALLVLHGEEHG